MVMLMQLGKGILCESVTSFTFVLQLISKLVCNIVEMPVDIIIG